MSVLRVVTALSAALLTSLIPASAQEFQDVAAPPHIAFVEGAATISRDGEREEADPGMPIAPGDVLRTDRGRLQILFPDGSALNLDEFSTFELLSPALYRLSEGRLLLMVAGGGGARDSGPLTIDTPMASAAMFAPGEYRLAMSGTPSGMQTLFEIIRGSGTLTNDRGATTLRAGEQSVAYGGATPTYPRGFNSARLDDFDLWAASLRRDRVGSQSAQYLPPDLRMYGNALDQYGSWQNEASYGNVWYPNVAADWQPYDNGYWSSVPAYGWTWIGAGPWAWPTHHYGRWGYQRSRWFWIPGRQWGPAWVSWGTAPGYVSWSPLGFNNRPVFALSVFGGSRWNGWTVVDRNDFGRPRWNVRQYSARTIPPRTSFVIQSTAPLAPPRRNSGNDRGVTGYPRGRTNTSTGWDVPRTNRPSSGFPDRSSNAGRTSGRTGTGRPDNVAVPRNSPRGASPAVTYSTPVPATPPGVERSGRQRRGIDTRSDERRAPGAATPAAPPPPRDRGQTGYARPRTATSAPPRAAQPPPDARATQPQQRPAGQARATRRSERPSPAGSSGSAQPSGSNNGGRAQGRRR